MRTRLKIGLAAPGSGARMLLEQLGLAYEVIRRWEALAPDEYAAVLLNDSIDSAQLARLDDYVKRGGALLDVGHFLPHVGEGGFSRRRVTSVVPEGSDPLFGDLWPVDLHAPLLRRDGAGSLAGLAHLGSHGDGHVAYLPIDIDRAFTDSRSARKGFYSPFSSYPNEIVSLVSKGEIRLAFERALIWLHAERGLPYLHRWYYPERWGDLFCYRIDSDYGTRAQVEGIYEAARRQGMKLTWFLHTEPHQEWLGRFAEFEGHEMGVHCHRHRTFRTFEENRANMTEAAHLLAEAGLPFSGYAAPNGFWNRELARAAESLPFEYSSEFSLAYDTLPFYPWLPGAFSTVLQVPVHPVCIGSFLRVKGGADVMKRYFRWVMERRLWEPTPVILYHHPGHEHFDVMEDSFIHARELGLHNVTMGEYARWWKRRAAVRYDAWWDGESLEVTFRHREPGVELALRRLPGEYGFMEGERMAYDAVTWDTLPGGRVPAPDDARGVRRPDPRRWRHAIEDYNARARQ